MNTNPLFLFSGLICFVGISFNSFASKGSGPNSSVQATELMHKSKALFFEENKGQLPPDPLPRAAISFSGGAKGETQKSDIKYYGHSNGVYVYCKPGMLSFVFTKMEKEPEQISEATGQLVSDVEVQNSEPLHQKLPDCDRHNLGGGGRWKDKVPQPSKISTARMDLVLTGSNLNAEITATDQQEYYENFYTTGDANHGITNVHTYKTVTYKNIYPNIDMILKTAGQGMEYSFRVHPGGNVGDIQLRWDGTEEIKRLKNLKIEYSCPLGKIEESAPKSFAEGKEVESSFIKKGAVYGFEISGYDKTKDLLIDPSLRWGTYFYDGANYLSIDSSGNIYIIGSTEGGYGLATSGAYQTSFAGTVTAFLVKFSSGDSLSWGTFYCGNDYTDTYGMGVFADGSGSVYIAGFTSATGGIATSGAFQTSLAGGLYDAFLAKFNSTGALYWATYYGGNQNEEAYAVNTDGSGNIYIAGWTGSDSGIATTGAYQTSYAGGNYDAFLAKFSSKGSLYWATYYGGSDVDIANSISIDKSGNVYISGTTYSTSGIATSGAYQTLLEDFEDAFLAKFSSKGSLFWATYYGGIYENEGLGTSMDAFGNIYITGFTGSPVDIATAGAYQTSITPTPAGYYEDDAFLAKFSSAGALIWATYYGGMAFDRAQDVSTDALGNVYITGYTANFSGIATSGAYQTSFKGGPYNSPYDAFLAKFSSSGALSWATYYGGSGEDEGDCIKTDAFGNVYILGYTTSTSDIATSGAYLSSDAGYGAAFLAKFHFPYQNDAGISSIQSPSGNLCGGTQPVKIILENYGASTLTSDSIYWKVNGTVQTPIKWTGSLKADNAEIVTLGTYNFSSGSNVIVAWSSKPNGLKDSLQGNDTAKISFKAKALPSAAVISDTGVCPGATISIGASTVTGSSYSWSSSPTGFSSTLSNPTVSPTSTTSYTLTESGSNGCVKSDSVTITVNPLPLASVISKTAICLGSGIFIGYTAVKGSKYSWKSSPPGFNSVLANPKVSPVTAASYTLTQTYSNGCINSNSVTITVNSLPSASVIPDTAICSGAAISIGSAAVPGSSYFWSSSDSGLSSQSSDPSVSPTYTDRYTLSETNKNGCVKSNSVTITVNPLPPAQVIPNTAICSGSAISIGAAAVSGSSYSWTSSASGFSSTSSNPSVSPTFTASYTLTETNAKGCVDSNSVTITVNALPDAFWMETNLSKDYYFHAKDSSLNKSSYTWDFGDGSAGATGYTVGHVFPKNKSYTVKLKVINKFGCTAEDDSMITVTLSGINSLFNADSYNLNIYPNPFISKTLISFTLPQASHVKISVMDMKGNVLFIPTDKTLDAGPNQVEINAAEEGLSVGTYFVNIEVNGQFISKKIIRIEN